MSISFLIKSGFLKHLIMSQVSFLATNIIRYFASILIYKKYYSIPNESNIKLWIFKPQQTLRIGTKY